MGIGKIFGKILEYSSMKQYDFYIVPTPIGNLGDMTERAIETLKNVDIIACEDIRVTQKLLNHFGIKTKCVSYHKFNEKERVNYFLELLRSGKKTALVSDAGTPLFCDPGAVIVKELRKNGFTVTALPGANAVATFLSQIARDGEDFAFAGFLPKKRRQIEKILDNYRHTDLVFYDSPNRILNTLEIIKECRENSFVGVARELTKVFEEVIVDKCENVIEHFKNSVVKGEFAVLVFRSSENREITDLQEKISTLKSKNFKAKEIAVILSSLYNINKNDIYKKIQTLT